MPVLMGKHVEALAQDKLPHPVEGKPMEEIRDLGNSTSSNIGLDAVVKLVYERKDLLFIMRQSWGH